MLLVRFWSVGYLGMHNITVYLVLKDAMVRKNTDRVDQSLGAKKIASAGKATKSKEVDEFSDLLDDTTTETGRPKRKHRYRPGTRALLNIRQMQKSTKLEIQRAPFRRLVKEIIQNTTMDVPEVGTHFPAGTAPALRITEKAYLALQESAEQWMAGISRECNRVARNSKRVKITIGDLHIVHDLITTPLDGLMNEADRFRFDGQTIKIATTEKEKEAAPPEKTKRA